MQSRSIRAVRARIELFERIGLFLLKLKYSYLRLSVCLSNTSKHVFFGQSQERWRTKFGTHFFFPILFFTLSYAGRRRKPILQIFYFIGHRRTKEEHQSVHTVLTIMECKTHNPISGKQSGSNACNDVSLIKCIKQKAKNSATHFQKVVMFTKITTQHSIQLLRTNRNSNRNSKFLLDFKSTNL